MSSGCGDETSDNASTVTPCLYKNWKSELHCLFFLGHIKKCKTNSEKQVSDFENFF